MKINSVYKFLTRNYNISDKYNYSDFAFTYRKELLGEIISLPQPVNIDFSYRDLVTIRESNSDFKGTSFSLEELSQILFWSAGELQSKQLSPVKREKDFHRPHPSGGSKYPIDIYICVDSEQGALQRGTYYYNPMKHNLVKIQANTREEIRSAKKGLVYEFAQDAPLVVFFSHSLERNYNKYGTKAYPLAMIESGHIAQNFVLLSAGFGYNCNPVLVNDSQEINKICNLDGIDRHIFYTLCVGKK